MLQQPVSVTACKAPHNFIVQSLTLWLALPCRDLKPHNVLLTEGQRAKLSDMGLCKRLFAEQTSLKAPAQARLCKCLLHPVLCSATWQWIREQWQRVTDL